MNQDLFPTEIKRIKEESLQAGEAPMGMGLEISWSDGKTVSLSSETLRRRCPCAECKEKPTSKESKEVTKKTSSLLKVLPAQIEEQINLLTVWQCGNYAIGLRWADGHSSGIYTFEHLRRLCFPESFEEKTSNG